MIKIIKNASVYTPYYIGKKDILIICDKIGAIEDEIRLMDLGPYKCDVIDGKGKIVFPGFIDSHVHILGGGGEGGFKTRTPEIMLSQIIKAGVTTIVGCLGTDGITRDLYSLLAKANALTEEGMTAYIYTGSYKVPVITLTGEVMKDIIAVDKIIGVGEIALSDHRSSLPTFDEFKRVVADARVGGMLSGKAGIVNVHIGDGDLMLKYIKDITNSTEIPKSQLLPTHVNRNRLLFKESIEYALSGGYIDMTTSIQDGDNSIRPGEAIKQALDKGVSDEHITFSSDGQGSLPIFNEKGNCIGLKVGDCSSLYEEVRYAITEKNVSIESAIKAITINPAHLLKLNSKGQVSVGYDADLCIVDENNLALDTVMLKGKIAMHQKKILMHGTFEVEVY